MPSTPASLCAALHVIKIGRVQGRIPALDEGQWRRIERGLGHGDLDARSAAFSAACHTLKRGEAPAPREMAACSAFVHDNLSVDSVSFRQVLLSDLSVLLLRARDSLTLAVRRGKGLGDDAGLLAVQLDELMEMLFRDGGFQVANNINYIDSLIII